MARKQKKKLLIKKEKKRKIESKETKKIEKQDRPKVTDELPENLKFPSLEIDKKEKEKAVPVLEGLEIPEQIHNLEEDLENVPGGTDQTKGKKDYDAVNDSYDPGSAKYEMKNFNDPKEKGKKYKRREDKMY